MPSVAAKSAKKPEKVPAQEPVQDPIKLILSVVEKKIRNLEKRKSKLDVYRQELSSGKSLDDDQRYAVSRYDEVIGSLEVAREFTKQFQNVIADAAKEEKLKKKRELAEKQQAELNRFQQLLLVQDVLMCMGSSTIQDDFINGKQGAVQLTEDEIGKLNNFSSLVSISREEITGSYKEAFSKPAEHFQFLLDGRNRNVNGASYRELKELVNRISTCGYFDHKDVQGNGEDLEPEVESVAVESAPQDVMPPEPVMEPAPAQNNGENVTVMAEVQPPNIPLSGPTSYFPVDNNTGFNFIQESMIDSKVGLPLPVSGSIPLGVVPSVSSVSQPTGVPVSVSLSSMDSAVVMVHPQVPHLSYSFIHGTPGASLFAPSSMVPQSIVQPSSVNNETAVDKGMEPHISEQKGSVPSSAQAETQERSSSSPWAEEPEDDSPPYQEQQRNESNTWTNSNFRNPDQDFNGRRGGYRGRGGPRGGPRGGGNGSGYYNSRGGANSGGGYQGSYRQPRGSYSRGGFRGGRRGGRGSSRGVYERN